MSISDTHFAEVEWRDGVPFSLQFQDYYFSKQSGVAESKYVFIEHNQLATRIQQLSPNEHLTIVETGFGGALNLLSTIITWKNTAKAVNVQLNYISIERYPLKPEDLKKLLHLFPELLEHASELLQQYYLLTHGYHRIYLGNNIYLTLVIDDVITALQQLNTDVDIWYFDGFSPNKNNEMWNNQVISLAAKLSHQQTTFSTYSANSELQRTLSNNGFIVNKAKGFGTKREMLYGRFNNQPKVNTCKLYLAKQSGSKQIKQIAIIGGGVSGATTAYSLARRGYHVTIFERNPSLAMEASGNNQGVIYGNFSIHDNLMFELSSNAYRLTNQRINALDPNEIYHQQCGVIQLSHTAQQFKRNQELIATIQNDEFVKYIDNQKITDLCGTKSHLSDGILFPHGMWLNPIRYIHDLVKHPNITVRTNQDITKFDYSANQWAVYSSDDKLKSSKFDALVICNSFMLNQFEQTKALRIRKIRGQVSSLSAQSPVNCVICGEGYVTPNFNDSFSFGATFDFKNENFNVTIEDHQQNINTLNSMLDINNSIDIQNLTGKTNIRVSPNDYLPIVGPISDKKIFESQFAKLKLDKNYRFKTDAEYIPNLFVNSGYGSKGLLWANLGGEIIADYISGAQLPISEILRQAIHPNRLYAREIIKLTTD